ncbi:hypothetical protein PM082_022055 [Marasmius tenuissimus]|nr:hypothetical protein PM082_022055 [Marasmius tenuissimus]
MLIQKFSYTADRNENARNLPVILYQRNTYGKLVRVLEFAATLPDGEQTTLVVTVIRPVKLEEQNKLGMPYYKHKSFGPIRVVDIDKILHTSKGDSCGIPDTLHKSLRNPGFKILGREDAERMGLREKRKGWLCARCDVNVGELWTREMVEKHSKEE